MIRNQTTLSKLSRKFCRGICLQTNIAESQIRLTTQPLILGFHFLRLVLRNLYERIQIDNWNQGSL